MRISDWSSDVCSSDLLTHATTAVARESVEFANGELPDDTDSDVLRSRSTRLAATAMLAARDGDDALLDEHEDWVREVVRLTLSQEGDSFRTSSSALAYNPQALSVLADRKSTRLNSSH